MQLMHKLTSMGAMLCDVDVVIVIRTRHLREPFTADEDDHSKMNA